MVPLRGRARFANWGRACMSTMYSECYGASEEGGSQLEIVSESPGISSVHDPRPETSDHVASRHPGPAPGGQCNTSLEAATRPEGMSKNQWKKLLKEQRRKEERKEWKRKMKEKDRAKRRKRKLEGHQAALPLSKKRKQVVLDGGATSVRVAIDLSYEHLMNDKDIAMLMKQCQRCYAMNRRSDNPVQLYITSFGGRCKERLDSATAGYVKWNVHFSSCSYIDQFGSSNVVFLAAESPNILADLDPGKVYVIGGLVDHNHYKGHCYQCAVQNGVAHAQLPISQFIKLNSRKVLAVNHVFEILLGFLKHKNWELAFYEVIPQRKIEPSNTHQDSLADPDRKIEPSNTYQELLTDPDRKIEPSSTHQDSVTDPDRKIEPSNTYQELLTDPDRKIEPSSTHQDSVTDPDRKIEPSNTYQELLTDPDRKIEPSNTYQELLTDPDRKIEPSSTHQDSVTDPDSSPRTQVQLRDEATGDEEEETGPCPPADCKERSSD